jgi:mRNA export factor
MFANFQNLNPNKDFELSDVQSDSISAIKFSPKANYIVAGSWDNIVRCWELNESGQSQVKAQQQHSGPVLGCGWHPDGTKVFTASTDKTSKLWDLQSNQSMPVAQHDAPIKSVHWIQAPNYQCLMTGSWDRKLKFWDTRQPNPVLTLDLPERLYCADVDFPLCVVGCADRSIICLNLDPQPQMAKRDETQLKYQYRCVAIFKDKQRNQPTGYALGSIEGRVAIQYINPPNPDKDNFTFKCHRSTVQRSGDTQEVYPVNAIAFHPVHNTLATCGSDGRYSFWDKDARTKLKTSEALPQPITSCDFSFNGNLFAYSASYDWSKGHEHYNQQKKNGIFFRQCMEELKPRPRRR